MTDQQQQRKQEKHLHPSLRIDEDNVVTSTIDVDVDPNESVPSLLFKSLNRYHDKRLMIDTTLGRKWTGRQLYSTITFVSSLIKEKDDEFFPVTKGDVVAFCCPNSDWHSILLFATSTRGGIYTGSDDLYPYREFLNVVKSSGASFIIASPKSLSNALQIQSELGQRQLKKVFLLDVESKQSKRLTRQIRKLLEILNNENEGVDDDDVDDEKREQEQNRQTTTTTETTTTEFTTTTNIIDAIHHKLSTLVTCLKNDGSDEKEQKTKKLSHEDVLVEINPIDDLYFIPFSSGTTGVPKAVSKTHYSFTTIKNLTNPIFDFAVPSPDRKVLTCHPRFCHVGGMSMLVLSLICGHTACILRGFSVKTFLQNLSDYRITTGFFVPSFITQMVRVIEDIESEEWLKTLDLTSLDDVLIAGEFMPKSISKKFIQLFNVTKYRQSFGSTEMGWSTCVPAKDSNEDNVMSSGIPLPGVSVKIMPLDGSSKPLRFNEIGEIFVRGPNQTLYYLNNESANKSGFDDDKFVKTGDGGYIDERGFLFVCDRFKEIIKFDGTQVSPSELESILLSYPGVEEAAVIGVPHEVHGHLPKGFVVMKDLVDEDDHKYDRDGNVDNSKAKNETPKNSKDENGDRNEDKRSKVKSKKDLEIDLLTFVNSQVAEYKQLRGGIRILPTFPRTVLGKTDRKFLRNNYS